MVDCGAGSDERRFARLQLEYLEECSGNRRSPNAPGGGKPSQSANWSLVHREGGILPEAGEAVGSRRGIARDKGYRSSAAWRRITSNSAATRERSEDALGRGDR